MKLSARGNAATTGQPAPASVSSGGAPVPDCVPLLDRNSVLLWPLIVQAMPVPRTLLAVSGAARCASLRRRRGTYRNSP